MHQSVLEQEYARATEWNLATLEELALLKSSSDSRVRRQVGICEKMLEVCAQLEDVDWTKAGMASRMLAEMRRGATARRVLEVEVDALRKA